MTSKKPRKQWELNSPIPIGGRVCYPQGDQRLRKEGPRGEGDVGPDTEWIIRPNGNNFAVKTVLKAAKSSLRASSKSHINRSNATQTPKSLQDFVEGRRSARAQAKDMLSLQQEIQEHHHCGGDDTRQIIPPISGVHIVRPADITPSDAASLGEEVWIPCRLNMDNNSVLWPRSDMNTRYAIDCMSFFNVENWRVVTSDTIEALQLSSSSSSSSSSSNRTDEVWTVCFMSRTRPSLVCWDPVEVAPHEDLIPFFVSGEGEAVWQVPGRGDSTARRRVQNHRGEIISCGFIHSTPFGSGAGTASRDSSVMGPGRQLQVLQRRAEKMIGSSAATPLPAAGLSGAEKGGGSVGKESRSMSISTLPLPSPSACSSLPRRRRSCLQVSQEEGRHEQEQEQAVEEEVAAEECGSGGAYGALTHLHTCDDVISLKTALLEGIRLDIRESVGSGNNRSRALERQSAWTEIASRDGHMLLRELGHLLVCAADGDDHGHVKGDDDGGHNGGGSDNEEVMRGQRGRHVEDTSESAARACLLAITHLCPDLLCDMLGRRRTAPFRGAHCSCCGCNTVGVPRRVTFSDDGPSHQLIRDHYMSPFSQVLSSVLEHASCLIGAHAKLQYVSPNVRRSGAWAEEVEISRRQACLDRELRALADTAALLLTVLESSCYTPSTSPATQSHQLPEKRGGSLCARCSRHCTKPLDTDDFDRSSGEDSAGGSRYVEELVTLLQWALELSVKASELPIPLSGEVGATSRLSISLHATLAEVSRVVCKSCTPLLPATLVWLQSSPSPSPSPSLSTTATANKCTPANITCGTVLLSFLQGDAFSQGGTVMRVGELFEDVMTTCLMRSVQISLNLFLDCGEEKRKEHEEKEGKEGHEEGWSSEYDSHREEFDATLALVGPTLKALSISASSICCLLLNRPDGRPAALSNEMCWEVVQSSLQFITLLHSRFILSLIVFPSCAILLPSLVVQVLELVDAMLFSFGLFGSVAEEMRDGVMQSLESLLDSSEEFQDLVVSSLRDEEQCASTTAPPTREVHLSSVPGLALPGILAAYSSKLVGVLSKCYDS